MSARKIRPALGTPVNAAMSRRDIAAAIGISTAELHRWLGLAGLPRNEFERRLATAIRSIGSGVRPTTTTILRDAPVPARSRVDRALALIHSMSPEERAELLHRLAITRPEASSCL